MSSAPQVLNMALKIIDKRRRLERCVNKLFTLNHGKKELELLLFFYGEVLQDYLQAHQLQNKLQCKDNANNYLLQGNSKSQSIIQLIRVIN